MTAIAAAVKACRGELEDRCAWHLAQLDRLEQQLAKLKEIDRLAQGLEAGEAPDPSGETPSPSPPPRGNGAAGNGGGPGASPAPKPARPRSKPRPAPQRAGAAAPKPKTKASGQQRRQAVLDAIRHGAATRSAIADATGITPTAILDLIRPLVAEGLVKPEGKGAGRRYRPAGTPPPAAAPPSPASAPKPAQPQPAPDGDGLRRRQQEQVLDTIHEHHPIRAAEIMKRTGIGQGGLVTALARLSERDIVRKDRKTGEWAPAPASRNGAPVGHGSPAGGQGPSLQGRVLEAVIYRPRPAAELARDLQEPQAAVEEELARLEADGDIICRPDQSFAPAIRGGV